MSITTIYSKNNCVNCDAAKSFMRLLGINYVEINVENDKKGFDYVVSKGYKQMPVIEFEEMSFSGFYPDKIKEIHARTGNRQD